MANDSISLTELKAKLEAVEAERQRLNTAYQVLEEMIRAKEATREAPEEPLKVAPLPPPSPPVSAPRAVWPPAKKQAPTVADRAIRELEKARRFLDTHELIEALVGGGYIVAGKKKPSQVYDSVYGSLDHARRKTNGRIVREDGKWGLRDWHEEAKAAHG